MLRPYRVTFGNDIIIYANSEEEAFDEVLETFSCEIEPLLPCMVDDHCPNNVLNCSHCREMFEKGSASNASV